ncbi:histidine phosphatase superfamily [Lasiosphaeria miniovina]|uniref:3-phytase n=1 Tax=Lasiosphaeria miniovina TaxID=1954250 RepID=A0AA40A4E2_9PEZI|nr:histidine phosphatase superfamily [Lasiosphaeria miniovina]KAK0709064.1 histidine phosphatase superfamily [Lasiosphaeria miniovina]
MAALVPRKAYTDEELRHLYPHGLELQLVQVLMRHGERTPVSARFQKTGLPAFWPYCASVVHLKSAVMTLARGPGDGSPFDTFQWKRHLETFGQNDEPVVATGPGGELDNVCDMGSLTDQGRQTTYKLGLRLRELYVDRLGFLPRTTSSLDFLYLRATPVTRALESLQQAFAALYPPSGLEADERGRYPVPTILTRAPADETLYPNDSNCRRFAALSRAFAQRSADRWNATDEMDYLNKLYSKWMPSNSRVAVDSRPRLSGIMDTINSTAAHGPETRLPQEFYDGKAKEIIEKITVEEWFAGFKESRDYRMLGVGGLLGDVVGRMVGSAEQTSADGESEIAAQKGQPSPRIKFGLSGCHDTTLAAVLASLGAFDTNSWPPFTSHIAIEMFRKSDKQAPSANRPTVAAARPKRSWWDALSLGTSTPPPDIGRRVTADLTPSEKKKLDGYYVRLRYNDEPVTIPGCKTPGNHLEGDESFCTLAAFKAIVDKFTPRDWKQQCRIDRNIPTPQIKEPEWAGY